MFIYSFFLTCKVSQRGEKCIRPPTLTFVNSADFGANGATKDTLCDNPIEIIEQMQD